MNEAVADRINNCHPILAQSNDFRTTHRVVLSIGKPQLERLKRLPIQPFSNRIRIHRFRPLEPITSSTIQLYHAPPIRSITKSASNRRERLAGYLRRQD
jgi:hypothetical protein